MGDVHPGACPRSRGDRVPRARGGSWRGGAVRHSANVTYCLFRGGREGRGEGGWGRGYARDSMSRTRWTRGWWEQLTLGVPLCPVDIRIIEKSTLLSIPPLPRSLPFPPPSRPPSRYAVRPTRAYALFTPAKHMGCCNQRRRWSWLIVSTGTRSLPHSTLCSINGAFSHHGHRTRFDAITSRVRLFNFSHPTVSVDHLFIAFHLIAIRFIYRKKYLMNGESRMEYFEKLKCNLIQS